MKKKAQKRIFVDHVIRLIKIFGIARERFRLKEFNYEKVLLTICSLVRLRIGALILA
ncbi:transposase family protein [Okeania sp. KiyG1]|uniref:transposase family protein n=1 Tax=Okeania sp. KiyG1 TaxID=2720165 RepID=UPI001923BAAB|nr:transposase family protein [Okeania sp. KiyG1]